MMKTVEDVWTLFKQLPRSDQSNLEKRAVEELDAKQEDERLSALESFFAGTKYRWTRTDRDQWHDR